MPKSWEQVLGGYATNTLTEEEKRHLFEAALNDQALFEALADEEGLKAMLADPEARQRILASLQKQPIPEASVSSQGAWWSWFRQPSHLAWAGSLATLALAVVFGWQFEKEWGPLVKEQQEFEMTTSKDDEASPSPEPLLEETDRIKVPERFASQSEPVGLPPMRAEAPQSKKPTAAKEDLDRLARVPAKALSDRPVKKESTKVRKLKEKRRVAPAPKRAFVQETPKEEQIMAPSVAMAPEPQGSFQPASKVAAFDEEVERAAGPSAPRPQDLFYAQTDRRGDEVQETVGGMRGQAFLGRVSPEQQGVSPEGILGGMINRDTLHDFSVEGARGIRYRVVRETATEADGERSQVVERKKADRLVLEVNIPGYLYVLASLGNGKWQQLVPISFGQVGKAEMGMTVLPHQPVEFSLAQLSQGDQKASASRLTVLLSPTPVVELSRWIGTEQDRPELEAFVSERVGDAIYVVDRSSNPTEPFHVEILVRK